MENILPQDVNVIINITDIVANIGMSVQKIKIVEAKENAWMWEDPLYQEDNVTVNWDGLEQDAPKVSL